MVNEITQVSVNESPTLNLPFTYDAAGNLEEKKTTANDKLIFRHDAWGRLVKVQFYNGTSTFDRAEYQYNGLHWRTVKRFDHDLGGSLDEQRVMFYSGGWRLLEERVYDGWKI